MDIKYHILITPGKLAQVFTREEMNTFTSLIDKAAAQDILIDIKYEAIHRKPDSQDHPL